MSRVLKFRAWSKIGAGMSPTNTLKGWIDAYALMGGCKNDLNDDKAIIMQFTGLLDKNGKEIYEGDVKDYGDYTDGKGRALYVVVWDERHGCFAEDEINGMKTKGTSLSGDGEIIGNIYENSDLLV